MCQCKVECALEKYTLTIYPCFEEKHQQSYRKGENTVIIGGSLIITAHLNYWVKQKETVNNKQKGYDVLLTNQLWLKLFHRVINILLTCLSVKRLRICESHIFELQIKMWMKVILAVMCTTWAVVKIRPKKIQACTGFDVGSK